ncbi:SMI1/KNR4 family protein [Hymenobacter persicinus]|uniref:SMI1/KNR4 family protein n=1 Tax=Hymenobacter persicinus TaxID=2025506 RepID=A0A4Q5LDV5_9BACT|nr:SMI1/KNR4 family protein [Hymenobacter persicinus]RYU81848.1 SMI1/KNR4 family protein [Hymenobacter persicinus]
MPSSALIQLLTANPAQTDISLYPAASAQLVSHFEAEMGLVLPADFKEFYSFCNGFESEEDVFRVIPLEEILERRSEHPKGQFYVAEYLIYGDMWKVELNEEQPGRYQISNHGSDALTIVLTDSLAEFIGRFLQGGVFDVAGLYEWREEIKKQLP